MFVPLHDGKPTRFIGLQWVTLVIIAANLLIFVTSLPFQPADGSSGSLVIGFGHIPSISNELRTLPIAYDYLPDNLYWLTGITYAFLHSGWWHLGGNMLFLWVFGDNVEDAMGHIKYLIFYLAAAFAAAWFHAFMFPNSNAPLIGASGSAAAIVAAYVMLHPNMKIWVLAFGRIPIRLPAIWVIGAWIAFQILMFFTDTEGAVSWAAHIAGIIFGIVLVGLLKRREVALFDRNLAHADAIVPVISEQELRQTKPINAATKSRWGRSE